MPPLDEIQAFNNIEGDVERQQRAIDELNRIAMQQQMDDIWRMSMMSNSIYNPISRKPFKPEPVKKVKITEEDNVSIGYDRDVDENEESIFDNRQFYDKTKGILDEVSDLYEKLVDNLLPFLEKDEYFIKYDCATRNVLNRFLIHFLWSVYRDNREKDINTFLPLTEMIERLFIFQDGTLAKVENNDTYIYRNLQEIMDISRLTFENILRLGEIKLNPSSNQSNIKVNGEVYKATLDRRLSKTKFVVYNF